MSIPTVSVIVAAHQAEETIERSVMSLLEQTEPDLEVIVDDDGSTDRTREIVADLAASTGDGRIVLTPAAANAGPSAARNRGIGCARGDWVAFLDADDEFKPEFLDRMLAATRTNDTVDVVVCAHELVQIDGERRTRLQSAGRGAVGGEAATVLALEYELTHYVWDKLFRRDTLGVDPFPLGVHRGEDLPVVLHAFMAAREVCIVDDVLHVYYVSPTSLTWGRVAPIEESERLIAAVRETVRPLLGDRSHRDAVQRAESLIYLHAAHQAITRRPRREAVGFCRRSAARIPWTVALRSVRSRPFDGAAQLLLKAVPSLYRRAYRMYVRHLYSISS